MNSRVLCAPEPSISARRDFQTLLRHRELQLAACNRSFTVIGHGPVGAKAEQLMQKAWAIEQAGFVMNPRVVLAMGFFDAFRAENGINEAIKRGASHDEIRKLIHDGGFSEDEMSVFEELAKRFRCAPIVVRSSAHGDCRGTGIYGSTFCLATAEKIANAAIEVLASEFSEDAVAFRKDAHLQGGMAVIVEPVFGEPLKPEYAYEGEMLIAPQYSGLAYTSTSSSESRIQFVAGMPTEAVKGGGFVVDGDCTSTFKEIVYVINSILELKDTDHRMVQDGFLKRRGGWKTGTGISLLDGYERELGICKNSLCNLSAAWLFEKLLALERILGKPQYVEFALVDRDGKAEAAILQMADVEIIRDFYEFSETRNIIARSNMVVGSGHRVCDGLVFVLNPDEVYLLSEYNRGHKDYIIVYGGRLTSSLLRHDRIRYSDLSNSAVVVEVYEMSHARHPVAHFEGMIQQSGKLFMVTGVPDWDRLERFKRTITEGHGTLEVYEAKFRVTASERQQKGIIELIEG